MFTDIEGSTRRWEANPEDCRMGAVHVIDVAWLDQLADVAGAKVEVDQDGGVCVSPASDGT